MIALTATASSLTKSVTLDMLLMKKPYEIKDSPNKLNITYAVEYLAQDADLQDYFGWLIDELKLKQEETTRTIIYCQTIKQCAMLYNIFKGLLGEHMFVGNKEDPKCVIVEMLHSCTPAANKDNILQSFQLKRGTIRVLIATIAFGMGVDCKAVHNIIHIGPPKSIEAYMQETGRAGRDGSPSMAYMLYKGILLNHVDANMKMYVKSDTCRRVTLLQHFDSSLKKPAILHQCCDNCSKMCDCGMDGCNVYAKYPVKRTELKPVDPLQRREITPDKKQQVEEELQKYRKSLVRELTNINGVEVKSLTSITFMLGFSDYQVQQVLDNLDKLLTLPSIVEHVEIWHMRHARKILSIIQCVFGDIHEGTEDLSKDFNSDYDDDDEFDNEYLNNWSQIMDDDMFEMALDNLPFTETDNSFVDDKLNVSLC